MAAIAGTLTGLFQWLYLRRHLPAAYWWIPANLIAAALAAPAGIFLGNWIASALLNLYYYAGYLETVVLLGFIFQQISLGLAAFVAGVVNASLTGCTLFLLSSPLPFRKIVFSVLKSRWLFLCVAMILIGFSIKLLYADNYIQLIMCKFQAPDNLPASTLLQRLLFKMGEAGRDQIFSIYANGQGKMQITDGTSSNYSPRYSPEGNRIVFVSNRDGNSEIHMLDSKGEHRLTPGTHNVIYPTWSPDGKRVAYTSIEPKRSTISVVDIDGSNGEILTEFEYPGGCSEF